MHLSEPNYELTAQQISTRDIAQLYLKVEENTEFLTNLVRHQNGRQRPLFSIEIQQIEIRSFFNTIVQVSYLMYTCTIRKTALFISRDIFIQTNRDSPPEIIFQFILQKELLNMSEQKQKFLQKSFLFINPFKHENAYASNLYGFIKNILNILNTYIQKHKDKKVLGDKMLMRQLETFTSAINFLEPYIGKGIKSKILISCLEQTQLFRVYSGLLITLNCSMYQNIRKTDKLKEIIRDIRLEQLKFNQTINCLRRDNKFTQQEAQLIQMEVQRFFDFLYRLKLITFDTEISSDSNSESVSKVQKIVEILKDGERLIKFCIKVESKAFRMLNQDLLNEIQGNMMKQTNYSKQQQSKKYCSFQIDLYPNRRMVCVKYLSEVQFGIQNSDLLMYLCNNMMMGWDNASMEQIERKKGQTSKKKQKLLVFKVISHFHSKDSPFINILLGIDMAMIYGKISQPQLTQKAIKLEDQARFIQTGKRINHLMSLFIKKIKRLYENTAQRTG